MYIGAQLRDLGIEGLKDKINKLKWFAETFIFQFYQAASVYRLHLLRHVLPDHELVVS